MRVDRMAGERSYDPYLDITILSFPLVMRIARASNSDSVVPISKPIEDIAT